MREMGEKTAARRVARAGGRAHRARLRHRAGRYARGGAAGAEKIGYPVMLKAAAGGGGKGIRFVHRPEELESSLRLARSEAQGAFGDSSVYMEKAVIPARHIEVQIFGDTHGNVIHLGERECSIQRRHQKLIEESPSPALDAELRARFTEAAVRLAQAVGYVNAGTCEFLLGPDGGFYFLEVNARLQVEHPVTELVTGTRSRARAIARGGGAAAERHPGAGRFPWACHRGAHHGRRSRSTASCRRRGVSAALRDPAGPGVRLDSALYDGMDIPLYYDSLLAKLICWGEDRDGGDSPAAARARRIYHRRGAHDDPICALAARQPRFVAGDFSTDFIAETWDADERATPAYR